MASLASLGNKCSISCGITSYFNRKVWEEPDYKALGGRMRTQGSKTIKFTFREFYPLSKSDSVLQNTLSYNIAIKL